MHQNRTQIYARLPGEHKRRLLTVARHAQLKRVDISLAGERSFIRNFFITQISGDCATAPLNSLSESVASAALGAASLLHNRLRMHCSSCWRCRQFLSRRRSLRHLCAAHSAHECATTIRSIRSQSHRVSRRENVNQCTRKRAVTIRASQRRHYHLSCFRMRMRTNVYFCRRTRMRKWRRPVECCRCLRGA